MTKIYGKEYFNRVYFAHRGLHDRPSGIPENSMAAFQAAVNSGYGVELDVQLSKDGQVVVFHDDTLQRMCSISGRVDDYDYKDLHKMSLAGTEHTICLFKDILEVLATGTGPLLCELKTGKRNKELCEKTYALLKEYPGVYCIESFDPFIVNWFRKNAPEVYRGQLAQVRSGYPDTLPGFTARLLSVCGLSFLNRPDFIAYEIGPRPGRVINMKNKGHLVFGWTSTDPDDRNKADSDALIFEGYRPDLRF